MNLSNYKNIHFIGIGGISMSSLAEILLSYGKHISGSDSSSSEVTNHLQEIGININIGQRAENINDSIDLVVYTAAVAPDNEELIAANNSRATVIDRAELVGIMMLEYKHPISVAGTHGKTTTSSLLTEVFLAAKANPTVSIGGILPSIGGNFRVGSNDYFLLETCEYCDSFLKFNPHSAIILNIDEDHIDYFKTLDNIYQSFNKFALRLPKDGFLVINNDIEDIHKVVNGINCQYITYGKDNSANWYPTNITYNKRGCASYTLNNDGKEIADISLSIPGEHNIYNSISVFITAYKYGLNIEDIKKGMLNYKGTNRRFQYKGEFNNVTVIDDYAHHPTEIKATINSARANKVDNLWLVFQPHTYTRTFALLDEFADCLKEADKIIILDIFSAREKDTGLVNSSQLVDKIAKLGGNVEYCKTFEIAENYILNNCNPHSMLITMGAGDVYKLGESLVKSE